MSFSLPKGVESNSEFGVAQKTGASLSFFHWQSENGFAGTHPLQYEEEVKKKPAPTMCFRRLKW